MTELLPVLKCVIYNKHLKNHEQKDTLTERGNKTVNSLTQMQNANTERKKLITSW